MKFSAGVVCLWGFAVGNFAIALNYGGAFVWFAAGWSWALVFALHYERWLARRRNA